MYAIETIMNVSKLSNSANSPFRDLDEELNKEIEHFVDDLLGGLWGPGNSTDQLDKGPVNVRPTGDVSKNEGRSYDYYEYYYELLNELNNVSDSESDEDEEDDPTFAIGVPEPEWTTAPPTKRLTRCRQCGHHYVMWPYFHKGRGKVGSKMKQPREVCIVPEYYRAAGFPWPDGRPLPRASRSKYSTKKKILALL